MRNNADSEKHDMCVLAVRSQLGKASADPALALSELQTA
jgi:hypothetical protein